MAARFQCTTSKNMTSLPVKARFVSVFSVGILQDSKTNVISTFFPTTFAKRSERVVFGIKHWFGLSKTVDEAGDLLHTLPPPPPRGRARATDPLSESVCVDVRDKVWALMRGAGREETVPWSSGPINVVEGERDTTYVFPK